MKNQSKINKSFWGIIIILIGVGFLVKFAQKIYYTILYDGSYWKLSIKIIIGVVILKWILKGYFNKLKKSENKNKKPSEE